MVRVNGFNVIVILKFEDAYILKTYHEFISGTICRLVIFLDIKSIWTILASIMSVGD